jgi:Camelysin metallo-endopeptidase
VKKIVIASAAMGGAALIAFGASGTFAELTDSTTKNVSAGASTLSLWVGHDASVSAQAGHLAPGDSVVLPYYVKNAGSTNVAANLGVQLTNLVNKENGCSSASEKTADSSCDGTDQNSGDFGSVAVYKVGVASASEQDCPAATTANAVGFLPFTSANDLGIRPEDTHIKLAANVGVCVLLQVSLPESATDAVQGDSMSFDATLTLKQA